MPLPDATDVHVNQLLTNVSVAWFQDQGRFIADKVFPNIPTQKESNRYAVFNKGDLLRSEARPRPPNSETAGRGFRIDNTPSYFALPIGVHQDIPDQVRSNQDPAIQLDRSVTMAVSQDLAIRREKDWVTNFFSTSIWTGSTIGGDVTPGTLWSAGGSTPVEDIRAEINAVEEGTGFTPNFISMGKDVWTILVDHPDITDRIDGGATVDKPSIVTKNLMAQLFEVDDVWVLRAVENTAAEGATDSMAYIGGKNLLVGYANPRPSVLEPSAGYTFSWTGYLGAAGPQGQVISRFRRQKLRATRVEGEMAYDQKVIAADLGAFMSAVVV